MATPSSSNTSRKESLDKKQENSSKIHVNRGREPSIHKEDKTALSIHQVYNYNLNCRKELAIHEEDITTLTKLISSARTWAAARFIKAPSPNKIKFPLKREGNHFHGLETSWNKIWGPENSLLELEECLDHGEIKEEPSQLERPGEQPQPLKTSENRILNLNLEVEYKGQHNLHHLLNITIISIPGDSKTNLDPNVLGKHDNLLLNQGLPNQKLAAKGILNLKWTQDPHYCTHWS